MIIRPAQITIQEHEMQTPAFVYDEAGLLDAAARISSAVRKCPQWIGSKVPPNSPTAFMRQHGSVLTGERYQLGAVICSVGDKQVAPCNRTHTID